MARGLVTHRTVTEQDSPLNAAAGAAGPETTQAFELLANETRMAILLALWEAHRPFTAGTGVSFSQLRDLVGVQDSGQFNYHLGKLEGRYVTSTEEGYKLTPAGNKITRAVIAGVGLQSPTLEPTEIDMTCPLCEAATEVTYRDGRLFQRCTECDGKYAQTDEFPEGTLFSWRFEPAGLSNRSPEEIWAACSKGMLQRSLAMIDRVCPECSGTVTAELEVCEDHDPGADDICEHCGREREILALLQCTVCKYSTGGTPGALVTQHPAVISFYYDHGVELQYGMDFRKVKRLLDLGESHEERVVSNDPLRIQVTVEYEGDELSLELDDQLQVLEVID